MFVWSWSVAAEQLGCEECFDPRSAAVEVVDAYAIVGEAEGRCDVCGQHGEDADSEQHQDRGDEPTLRGVWSL